MSGVEVSSYLCPAVADMHITHSLVKHVVLGLACMWCHQTEEELLAALTDNDDPTATMVKPPVF